MLGALPPLLLTLGVTITCKKMQGALPPLLLTLGVTITCKKMQEQGDDATTVATSLWHAASKVWKHSLMWQHILECFEAGQMTPFPLDIQK